MDYGSALDNIEISETEELHLRIAELEAQVKELKERPREQTFAQVPFAHGQSVTDRVREMESIDLDKEERKWAEEETQTALRQVNEYAEERERRINACPNCGV